MYVVNYSSDLGAINTSWSWQNSVPVFLDNVECQSTETTLLNCSHFSLRFNCHSGRYHAAVKCSEKRLRVQNVSVATVNTTAPTIMITWELYSGAPYKPSSFKVECFNRRKEFSLWVNNGTLAQYRISVGDLLSSTFLACCVSAIYYGYYETKRQCTSTDSLLDQFTTPAPNLAVTLNVSFTTPTSTHVNSSMMPASVGSENSVIGDKNMKASIISGVLGSIIIILLLLLAICGGVLLFLLRSRNMTEKTLVYIIQCIYIAECNHDLSKLLLVA